MVGLGDGKVGSFSYSIEDIRADFGKKTIEWEAEKRILYAQIGEQVIVIQNLSRGIETIQEEANKIKNLYKEIEDRNKELEQENASLEEQIETLKFRR